VGSLQQFKDVNVWQQKLRFQSLCWGWVIISL
jgi:hypothetical protein